MSTENKAVSCYLPSDVEKYLTKYCVSNGLIRKNKDGLTIPSLGTGIVSILSEYFNISSDESDYTNLKKEIENSVMDKVNDLVNYKLSELLNKIDKLQNKIETVNREEESIKSNVLEQDLNQTDIQQLSLSEILSSDDKLYKFSISGLKLSKLRFGLSKSAIAVKKRSLLPEHFLQWTQEKDPDGVAWQYVDKKTGYVPAIELSSELEQKLSDWFGENEVYQ